MGVSLPPEHRVPAGTVLFRQGDVGDEMYIIARGRVRLTLVEQGCVADISVLEPGEFFGELSLLSGAARTATAEVIEDATLLVIGRDAFAILVQDDLDVVYRMMHVIGQRLTRADARLRGEMQRSERIRVLVHCLRRCLADEAGSTAFELGELASAVDVSPTRVHTLVTELAARGIGTLRGGSWVIGRAEARGVVDALADCVSGGPS